MQQAREGLHLPGLESGLNGTHIRLLDHLRVPIVHKQHLNSTGKTGLDHTSIPVPILREPGTTCHAWSRVEESW